MKKTIVYNLKNNQLIGFANATIDPEATKQKALEIVSKTNIYKECCKLEETVKQLTAEKQSIQFNTTMFHIRGEINEFQKAKAMLTQINTKCQNETQKLICAKEQLIDLIAKTRKENYVYFEPKPGEEIIEDDFYQKMLEKQKELGTDEILLKTGEVIKND